MDSKILEMLIKDISCALTEKSDIYSLGVIFWELTSQKSPFGFEGRNNQKCDYSLINIIRNGEEPVTGTNVKFVVLYKSKYKIKYNNFPQTIFIIIFTLFY